MKEYLFKYINENFKVIKILIICLIVGLIAGIIVFQCLNQDIKNELIGSIKSTLDISKDGGFENINILKNGITSNILIVILIYFASITMIAPVFICILNIFKGFSIGMYIPTLFLVFGFAKGLLVLLLIVVLPNLIYIPSYIYICVNSINFHYKLVEEKNKLSMIIKESYKLIMIFSILIEQLASFGVISLYLSL